MQNPDGTTTGLPPYEVTLIWNGKIVLTGRCSAVVGYEVSMAHLCEQFAGTDHKAFVSQLKATRPLEAILRGDNWNYQWKDETGQARAVLTRVD